MRARRARRPVEVPGHREQPVAHGGQRGVVVEAGAPGQHGAGLGGDRHRQRRALRVQHPRELRREGRQERAVGGRAGLEVDVDAVVAVLATRPRCAGSGWCGWPGSREVVQDRGVLRLDARLDAMPRRRAQLVTSGSSWPTIERLAPTSSRSARRPRSAGSGAACPRSSCRSRRACRRRRGRSPGAAPGWRVERAVGRAVPGAVDRGDREAVGRGRREVAREEAGRCGLAEQRAVAVDRVAAHRPVGVDARHPRPARRSCRRR